MHPLQAILDYPLAFAMLGFCALPKGRGHHEFKYYIPSTLFAILLRFVCHFLSGIIFYGSVDFTKGGASLMDALNPANLFNWGSISYSVTYNLGYLLPDALICLVVLALLWKPLNTLLIPQYKN